ncbi:MAG: chorismate synthase [Prevotella sp.]|nr:chorismate synthase [Prevotella sp.]MCM1074742.1 chorismate synthase [Ruminococcus sp.]
MNSFGQILKLTTFGESHGPAIGGILDGVPSGFLIDLDKVQTALNQRRPGGDALGSRRNEVDKVQILSGIFNGTTLGSPIGFIIPNTDAKSKDYENLKDVYRPNHADFTYSAKYGIRDYRGGGRSSARETACRVCAGAVAEQILDKFGIKTIAFTSRIGQLAYDYSSMPSDSEVYSSIVRCPSAEVSEDMTVLLNEVRKNKDSVGGEVICLITGVPAGLGEPVFDKLHAQLAAAMMSIPAAKGFEYGQGFNASRALGSESVDHFVCQPEIHTVENHSGGIQGGISNGNIIEMRVAFKPAPSIMQPIETVDSHGNPTLLEIKGRHDVCVVPRAVPVVKSMAALVILDALMLHRSSLLRNI